MQVDSIVKAAKQAATLALFPERALDAYAAVECNDSFLDEMQDAVEWGSPVILYCGTGGVIGQPELNFADGAQTASLIAAHELCARGWGTENVKRMAGGLGMWEEIEGLRRRRSARGGVTTSWDVVSDEVGTTSNRLAM